jgi:hypothetical protein
MIRNFALLIQFSSTTQGDITVDNSSPLRDFSDCSHELFYSFYPKGDTGFNTN